MIKIDYLMAKNTLSILEALEEKGIIFYGLTQDWQELIANEECKMDKRSKKCLKEKRGKD